MKMMHRLLMMLCICFSSFAVAASEITPHKYTDAERQNGGPKYDIPSSSRFTTKRIGADSPDIVYYFSKPSRDKFPIAILVGGSSLEDDITSIIHFHRYFLKEFLDLGVGVITIEQQGVYGNQINKTEFMEHYTRSNRLSDHRTVIEHLKKHPPKGWNRILAFVLPLSFKSCINWSFASSLPATYTQYKDYKKTCDRNSGIDFLSSRLCFIGIICSPVITD